MEQARHHRTFRDVERPREIFVTHALDLAEQQDRPVLLRDLLERLFDLRRELLAKRALLRVRAEPGTERADLRLPEIHLDGLVELDRLALRTAAPADHVDADVDGDPVE